MSSRKTYKFRLYPSKSQTTKLEMTLDLCRELYNSALQERRDAWKLNHINISNQNQEKQLPEIKTIREDLNGVHSQVLQNVLKRVDLAFQAFFGRVKRKAKAGFPRFRVRVRYDSFTYPQLGFSVQGAHLCLSKIGRVKIKLHRPLTDKIKTLTIKREAGRWFACFSVECEAKPLPACKDTIGIDVGLTAFATLSDGTEIENPRYYVQAQKQLRLAQRKVARRKRGSNRRRFAVQLLQRAHAHIHNQRADFHHKISRRLVDNFGVIAVEDLQVKGLASGMLAKSVNDAGWSAFIAKLMYKAESAGRDFVKVDPRGTSQTCLCGAHTPNCSVCSLSAKRDHVSAQLILSRAGIPLSSVNASR